MRLDYGKTFVLGLGFMVISMTLSEYNAFVPVAPAACGWAQE